jgi:hypothetical protein
MGYVLGPPRGGIHGLIQCQKPRKHLHEWREKMLADVGSSTDAVAIYLIGANEGRSGRREAHVV